VTKVAKVTEDQVIEVNDVHRIETTFGPLHLIVKGAHTGNQDPTNLVFTGTINNKNAITERSYCAGIIVIRVMMTYRNDRCCRTSEIETNRTMIGIADDRTITTANSETGVTRETVLLA
jgi:hypothetical protein